MPGSEDKVGEVLDEFHVPAVEEGQNNEQVQNTVSTNAIGVAQRGSKLSLKQTLESKAGAA